MARLMGSKDKEKRKSKPLKQFCPKGHDTFVCGRSEKNQCLMCLEEYYIHNQEERKEYQKQYSLEHKEEIKEYKKVYRQEHRKEINEKTNIYVKNRRTIDINFKLGISLRHRLYMALKHNFKAGSAVKDLGCSIEFLKSYLESKFLPGMTWENYGKGKDKWNVDHIIPLASFDLTEPVQFAKVVHYTNLQPLWEPDNLKKGKKIIYVK